MFSFLPLSLFGFSQALYVTFPFLHVYRPLPTTGFFSPFCSKCSLAPAGLLFFLSFMASPISSLSVCFSLGLLTSVLVFLSSVFLSCLCSVSSSSLSPLLFQAAVPEKDKPPLLSALTDLKTSLFWDLSVESNTASQNVLSPPAPQTWAPSSSHIPSGSGGGLPAPSPPSRLPLCSRYFSSPQFSPARIILCF